MRMQCVHVMCIFFLISRQAAEASKAQEQKKFSLPIATEVRHVMHHGVTVEW